MTLSLQVILVYGIYYHMATGTFLKFNFILKSSNINRSIKIFIFKMSQISSRVNDIPNEEYGIFVPLIWLKTKLF